MTIKRLHAQVYGMVQGVGFRFFVVEAAKALDLTGWVRNRFDGSVEVMAEGEEVPLEELAARLHEGPRLAFVSKVEAEWHIPSGEFGDFNAILRG